MTRILSQALVLSTGCLALACAEDSIVIEGEYGRAVPLASGDASLVPRLLVRRDGCPGSGGGCTSVCDDLPANCPADACMAVVIDSSAPVTAISADVPRTRAERGCLEVRAAAGTLASEPTVAALAGAIARFRFTETPMAIAPEDDSVWDWRVGDDRSNAGVGAVLGGNLLRKMAVRFVHQPPDLFTVTFYGDFPGSEGALADQGRAFIPLQFPGQLLGKEITDVCSADDEDCDFIGFEFDNDRIQSLVQPTQMLVDACLAAPAGAVDFDDANRRCRVASGPGYGAADYRTPTGRLAAPSCRQIDVKPADQPFGGRSASLVVATGIPDMVLFEDSARRFFGDLDALPACAPEEGSVGGLGGIDLATAACLDGQDGVLYAPGWPAAGSASAPLTRIRVRNLGLVPGLAEATGIGACQRLEKRVAALKAQCDAVVGGKQLPYPTSGTSCASAANDSAVLLGEVAVRDATLGPNPSAWIRALVVPADHPLTTAIRRDVVPEGLQPDGLLGTALLRTTDVILDYTDENPGVRVACSEPGRGTCVAMPACSAASGGGVAPRCCFGLPEDLLVEMISDLGLYGCCPALAENARRELNCQARAEGREEPCPEVPCD